MDSCFAPTPPSHTHPNHDTQGDAGANFQKGDNNDDYVPRVYFLNKDGTFYDKGVAPNPDFEFFFPGADSVLRIANMLKEDNDVEAETKSQGEM